MRAFNLDQWAVFGTNSGLMPSIGHEGLIVADGVKQLSLGQGEFAPVRARHQDE